MDGTLLLVASPTLARALVQWNLVDEFHIAISPIVAGLQSDAVATLLGLTRLRSGVVIHRYGFGVKDTAA